MRAVHWLVGCALCIAGIGGASAASVDSQDLDNSPRTLLDSSSAHDGNTSSGGDATGLGHDCPPASSTDNSGSNPGNAHSGGGSSTAPAPSRRPHLGWQSLLPGSIQ
ncbi:hypothetical protein [Rhodanobacter ginsengiterrae]|uniref:hypothetical protein n=1 Tax=Rhodanobacter ginsengiterrae TaxID=2008451 RepID=UPI003CEE00DE